MEIINTVGRRKASIARVYLKKGTGNITINGIEYKEYFPQMHINGKIVEAINEVGVQGLYDFNINVKGGGIKGQAEAIRMGMARALVKLNEEFRSPLKSKKYLTRDARVVERKKYGKPKARKSFQFSKR
jgi:small subunit ribosomal protein S9